MPIVACLDLVVTLPPTLVMVMTPTPVADPPGTTHDPLNAQARVTGIIRFFCDESGCEGMSALRQPSLTEDPSVAYDGTGVRAVDLDALRAKFEMSHSLPTAAYTQMAIPWREGVRG